MSERHKPIPLKEWLEQFQKKEQNGKPKPS